MNKKWDELEEKLSNILSGYAIDCLSYNEALDPYDDIPEIISLCMNAFCDEVEKEIEKLKCEGLNDGQAIHNTALLQVQQTINKLRQG